jgi:hypothetical protein
MCIVAAAAPDQTAAIERAGRRARVLRGQPPRKATEKHRPRHTRPEPVPAGLCAQLHGTVLGDTAVGVGWGDGGAAGSAGVHVCADVWRWRGHTGRCGTSGYGGDYKVSINGGGIDKGMFIEVL